MGSLRSVRNLSAQEVPGPSMRATFRDLPGREKRPPAWTRDEVGLGAEVAMRSRLVRSLRGCCAGVLLLAALASAACQKSEPGEARGDAGSTGLADTRAPGPDARRDTQGTVTDTTTAPDTPRADGRGLDLVDPAGRDGAPTDVRGADAGPDLLTPTSPEVRAADLPPADLAGQAADGPAPSDASAPPNNGSVDGLTVVAANATVGLDWPRVADAAKYRVYFANAPGLSKGSQVLESIEPAMVHRGLVNGSTYYYAVAAVTAAGEGPLSREASATPGGEWVLEELGAGDFDDVTTGRRVSRLAVKDRIHILLFAEGYLESELGKLHDLTTHGGTRANDVDRWVDEVFKIEPYALFRGAFVVWFLPRASAAHLGQGATAFGVKVGSGGVSAVTAAAAPLFSALDAAGTDAFAFPPGSPVVNHVAAFLLYDPARGRASWSGLSTTLQNPADRNQRIPAAFGVGHAHEFTHAFAGLRDEYLETSNSVRPASETANTSPTNTCGTLPWAHLLAGAGIHGTPGLVGAFGTAALGYHPELKCLMNGTHDNGQFFCAANASGSYPNLTLRVDDRMCNFCREITTYRVFDRTRVLSGSAGFASWKSEYRAPFYQRFGFKVPATVPQTLRCPEDSAARAVFHDCVP